MRKFSKRILQIAVLCLLLFQTYNVFIVQQTYGSYNECETGTATACNPYGSTNTTGQVMTVTSSGGTYSCQYADYNHYKLQSAETSCVARICSNYNTYSECGDTTGGPCDNGGKKELITVTHCLSNGTYYCWNKGPQPGCGLPYSSPTPSSSPTSALPPNTPTPTFPAAPTATPTNAPATLINIALQLPGIGVGGNLSPKHNTRTLHISIYASNVDPSQPNVQPIFDSKTETLTYNTATGYFTNTGINLGNLSTDDYQLLVKVPGYLRKQFTESNSSTKTIHITGQTTTLIPSIKLIAGDVGPLFNVMDAADFYGIVGCYKDKATTSTCAVGSQIADINDDGTVDGIDLNYWLLGFQSLVTNNDPSGTGDGITGD